MRKFKSTLMIVAVILGIGGAAVTKAANYRSSIGDPILSWFNDQGSTNYVGDNTVAAEKDVTGCKSTVIFCENGYTNDQLVDPSDPSQGPKAGEMPTVIQKAN